MQSHKKCETTLPSFVLNQDDDSNDLPASAQAQFGIEFGDNAIIDLGSWSVSEVGADFFNLKLSILDLGVAGDQITGLALTGDVRAGLPPGFNMPTPVPFSAPSVAYVLIALFDTTRLPSEASQYQLFFNVQTQAGNSFNLTVQYTITP